MLKTKKKKKNTKNPQMKTLPVLKISKDKQTRFV